MSTAFRFLRSRNLGQYEHTELEISDVVPDGQQPTEAVKQAMAFVRDALYEQGTFSPNSSPKTDSKKVEEAKVETPKEGKTTKTETKPPKEAKKDKEEVKKDESSKESSQSQVQQKSEDKSDKKETEVKKEKPGKNTTYNRFDEKHKELVGKFMDAQNFEGGWRDGLAIKKASAVSKQFHGDKVDFLDPEGNVLESFRENFLKAFKEQA